MGDNIRRRARKYAYIARRWASDDVVRLAHEVECPLYVRVNGFKVNRTDMELLDILRLYENLEMMAAEPAFSPIAPATIKPDWLPAELWITPRQRQIGRLLSRSQFHRRTLQRHFRKGAK
jgi:hypothetical protein